jgi:hypothetical protein
VGLRTKAGSRVVGASSVADGRSAAARFNEIKGEDARLQTSVSARLDGRSWPQAECPLCGHQLSNEDVSFRVCPANLTAEACREDSAVFGDDRTNPGTLGTLGVLFAGGSS